MIFKMLFAGAFIVFGLIFAIVGVQTWEDEENSFIPLILGIFFALIGVGFVAEEFLRRKKEKRLRETGKLIKASIAGTVEEKHYSKGRTYIYSRVKVEYNGKTYTSEYLTDDGLLNLKKLETVDLYIDRENDKKYFIDLTKIN